MKLVLYYGTFVKRNYGAARRVHAQAFHVFCHDHASSFSFREGVHHCGLQRRPPFVRRLLRPEEMATVKYISQNRIKRHIAKKVKTNATRMEND